MSWTKKARKFLCLDELISCGDSVRCGKIMDAADWDGDILHGAFFPLQKVLVLVKTHFIQYSV